MKIVKERSRLIFSNFTPQEKRNIEQLVSTMDKIFTYHDEDKQLIFLPTGIEAAVKKKFNLPIEDKSKTYWDASKVKYSPTKHYEPRNQMQKDAIAFGLSHAKGGDKMGLILPPGAGKGHPISTKIPTLTGYKLLGDLKVDDTIFGSSGQLTKVVDIYELGEQDIYKVTFNDRRESLCTEDHLWTVRHPWSNKSKTIPLSEMIKNYRSYQSYKSNTNRDPYSYNYHVQLLSNPVQYESKPIPIDPYTVGAFIGNGCCRETALSLSSGDDFVPQKICDRNNLYCRRTSYKNFTYNFYDQEGYFANPRKRIQTEEFFKDIPEIINSYSRDKVIPEIYIYNSHDVRMELLRGLMDTDGSITISGNRHHVSYSSSSKILLLQMQELIWGLGFNGNISIDKRISKYVNGYHGTLMFNIPHSAKSMLFSHPIKHNIAVKANEEPTQIQQQYKYLIVKNIDFSHREQARCIRVDSSDSLYLTENFIVTHNTFMASYLTVKIGLKTLIIAPTTSVRDQWADSLKTMFNIPDDRIIVARSATSIINADADYVVTLQTTIANLNKNYDLEKILKDNKFGVKIIDEAHMFFHNIIKVDGSANILHNWYVTATFGRSSDEEDRIYKEVFGDISLFRVKDKKPTLFNRKPGDIYGQKPHMNVDMYWMHSGLTKDQVASIARSTKYGINIPKYTELIIPSDGTKTVFVQKLISIVKRAESKTSYGRTLILTPTINSVETMAVHLKKAFPRKKIGTIHSRNKKEENDRVKLEDDIMISTVKSSGTGFDVKNLAKLIVAEQFKSLILAEQVSGRLRRLPDGFDTYMHDIVDRSVKQLRMWGNARSQLLKRKSKKFTVIDY